LTDGSGHRDGTRAVGLARGAWEQLAAIPTATLAAIPDAASDAQAATLPTARMTTLRALEVSRLVLGKRSDRARSLWRQPARALNALLGRRIGGKAVLHVD